MSAVAQIPSMWREELLHPLLAHLPIAFIPLALALRLAATIFSRNPSGQFLLPASKLVTVLAACAGWVAFYTGGIAEDVVNRVICDPTVTHEHEDLALWTSSLLTGAAALDIASLKLARFARPLSFAVLAVLLACGVLVAKTGHLGAKLVYQQGAAVYHPTPECTEFE